MDNGPWVACAVGSKVFSEDFRCDVGLHISGDFGVGERKQYADWLAATLNAAHKAADEIERLTASNERIQTLHEGLMADAEKRYEEVYREARALTAERDGLRKQWQAEQHVVEVLRRDAERLDWIQRNRVLTDWKQSCMWFSDEPFGANAVLRDAIDAAMKAGEAG